jgi:hypothetical protein
MKKVVFALVMLLLTIFSKTLAADNVLQVNVDSAFIRAAPDLNALVIASAVKNDSLIAVGRNIDGLWLEVRRPARADKVGWIARRVVMFNFDVAALPMTDLSTGVTGSEPIVDSGVSVTLISKTPLRAAPDRFSTLIDTLPFDLTLPVLSRTPDAKWLKINFRGVVGWIPEYLIRAGTDVSSAAVDAAYAADAHFTPLEKIPPEVQLAQIDRLRAYLDPINATAADVTFYWEMMSRGETMECKPPAGNYAYYAISSRDLVELPELRQQQRLLQRAIDDINTSIEAMRKCGVYTESEVRSAYAKAINAGAIFRLVIQRVELRREKIQGGGKVPPTG